jgi:hypothetical protein
MNLREEIKKIVLEHILTENYPTNQKYMFDGEIVVIDRIEPHGAEVRVFYRKEDGTKETYVSDYRDFYQDFQTYYQDTVVNKEPKKVPPQNIMYNLLYVMSPTNKEYIARNINIKLAYALKGKYSKLPEYRSGKFEIQKIS